MFSYLGSKSKIVHLYPAPKHDLIIEPFAGSARYALKYWENEVLLYDLSPYVVEVWKFLIAASKQDVLGLPDVPSKVCLDTYTGLTDAERYLIGFHLCRGKAKPRRTGHGQNSWVRDRQRIADSLFKVKHWQITQGSFADIPNQFATWFIDPPYKAVQERKGNSDRYPHWFVDYAQLAVFAGSRWGQVIVCEGEGADYLPFRLLAEVNTNTNNRITKKAEEYSYER